MCQANRSSDELRKNSHARVRLEKFRVVGKKRRMQELQNSGRVDFRVFNGGMITVNPDGRNRQCGEKQEIVASHPGNVQTCASLERTASIAGLRASWVSLRPCESKIENCARPLCCRKNFSVVCNTPKPYFTLRLKLIDEASAKYLVGQETSPIR